MSNEMIIYVNGVRSVFETFAEAVNYLQACEYEQDCILDSMGLDDGSL